MTAASQILAGARLTAALLQGVAPLAAIKGTDQSVTSSTALVSDSALFLQVAANAGYFVVTYIAYEGFTQGSSDMKWQWTGPAGATLSLTDVYYPTSGGIGANTNIAAITALSTVRTSGTSGAGVKLAQLMFGTLTTGGTSGTFQFQWAQNTSSATATIVHAGSAVAAWQVQ